MSTDYRVEMRREDMIDQQARELTKTGMSLDDAYEMVEDWHMKNDYTIKKHRLPARDLKKMAKWVKTEGDLTVWDAIMIWKEHTGSTIPSDIVKALESLKWEGRNGGTRAFKDRSIIQVLRYFIKYYEEK
mgnify:FL=1